MWSYTLLGVADDAFLEGQSRLTGQGRREAATWGFELVEGYIAIGAGPRFVLVGHCCLN